MNIDFDLMWDKRIKFLNKLQNQFNERSYYQDILKIALEKPKVSQKSVEQFLIYFNKCLNLHVLKIKW